MHIQYLNGQRHVILSPQERAEKATQRSIGLIADLRKVAQAQGKNVRVQMPNGIRLTVTR